MSNNIRLICDNYDLTGDFEGRSEHQKENEVYYLTLKDQDEKLITVRVTRQFIKKLNIDLNKELDW